MGSILPIVLIFLKYRCMFTTRLETHNKSRKEDVEDFIDNCIEIDRAEEEVKNE